MPPGSGSRAARQIAHLRWWTVGAGTVLVAAGHLLQLVQASFLTIGLASALTLTAHLALDAVVRSGQARPSLELVAAALDLVTAALLVVFFGPGALAIALLAAALPHLSKMPVGHQGPLTLVVGATYLVAATLHGALYANAGSAWWMPSRAVLLEATVVTALTWVFAHMSARLRNRIQGMSRLLTSAGLYSRDESGNRVAVDPLGSLEHSLNRSVDCLKRSKAELSQLADQTEALAEELSVQARSLVDSGQRLATISQQVASTAHASRLAAEARLAESRDATQGADELSSATGAATAPLEELHGEAGAAHETLGTAIEASQETVTRLHYAATTASDLGAVAKQVDNRTQQLLKVARQTHVLALNAAIEAAREDEHGRGFAVIAEQVRELAEDARRSAREVADLTGQMLSRVQAVTGEIEASRELTETAGTATSEANAVVGRLRQAVLGMADQSKEATACAHRHAERLQSLIEPLSSSAVASEDCCRKAESAANLAEVHVQASRAVSQAAEELVRLLRNLHEPPASDADPSYGATDHPCSVSSPSLP